MTHKEDAERWIDLLRELGRAEAIDVLAGRLRLTEICAKNELMAEVQAEFKKQFGDIAKASI